MTQWGCICFKVITKKDVASMVRPSFFFFFYTNKPKYYFSLFPQCLRSLYGSFWGKIEGKHKRPGKIPAGPVLAGKGISIPQERMCHRRARIPGQGPASLTKSSEGMTSSVCGDNKLSPMTSSQHHILSLSSPGSLSPDPKGFLCTHVVLPVHTCGKSMERQN